VTLKTLLLFSGDKCDAQAEAGQWRVEAVVHGAGGAVRTLPVGAAAGVRSPVHPSLRGGVPRHGFCSRIPAFVTRA